MKLDKFSQFEQRMLAEDLPDLVIKAFQDNYHQLVEGQTGFIRESTIKPVDTLPDMETLTEDFAQAGEQALPRTVMIKLNGGLGTSMGLNKAKSLLVVKSGLTFLDIIARQALSLEIPVVWMNSYSTSSDTLEALKNYPGLLGDLPVEFLQHKVPKIRQEDLTPAVWPSNPQLEWHPPGHGDIYTALMTSGMLNQLLDQGFEFAFISNADNLGAVANTTLLGYFSANQLPWLMEAADRTPADRKGGHLASLPNGQLILRESAQCHPEDVEDFQDIHKHIYFNTNNLWIHLPTLNAILQENAGSLHLPMIRNEKTLDPQDNTSPPVYQLETAMGSAISRFQGAEAIRVPRTRFAPVKTTNDLFSIRSDSYLLDENYQIVANPAREYDQLVVRLDDRYFRLINDLEQRLPFGPPSTLHCKSLIVEGDVLFGKEVTLHGNVEIINPSTNQIRIPHKAVLKGLPRN